MSQSTKPKSKKMSLNRRHNLTGWAFLTPATIMIAVMSFLPMIQAFILSLQKGKGTDLTFTGFGNYVRMFQDSVQTIHYQYICLFNYSGAYHADISTDSGIYAEQ